MDLLPNVAYKVPEVAEWLGVGPRSLYRAISRGEMRAAKLNERGDLRVLGKWVIEYLESIAPQQP